MKIIVGLGNPGKEYEKTRHNIGFCVADEVAATFSGTISIKRFSATTLTVKMEQTHVLLIKPQTLMNASGISVGQALQYHKKGPKSLLVVHDDLDLPLGRLKFSEEGTSGGHKGLDSIIETIGTRHFDRLRLGIGRPERGGDAAGYVLSPFDKGDTKKVDQLILRAVDAVLFYIAKGPIASMNFFNVKEIT